MCSKFRPAIVPLETRALCPALGHGRCCVCAAQSGGSQGAGHQGSKVTGQSARFRTLKTFTVVNHVNYAASDGEAPELNPWPRQMRHFIGASARYMPKMYLRDDVPAAQCHVRCARDGRTAGKRAMQKRDAERRRMKWRDAYAFGRQQVFQKRSP